MNKWRKKLVLGVICCLVAVSCYLFFPNSNNFDSYSVIRSEISRTPNARVLEVAPDLQPRYFPWTNPIPVAKESADPAQDDRQFMRAASIDQIELVKYLNTKGITHLLVAPLNGVRNHIFYRWSSTPSVDLRLTEPYFREAARAFGDYPATLFEVSTIDTSDFCLDCSGIELAWRGIRETAIETSRFGYLDGPDFAWVLGQDRPSLLIRSKDNSEYRFRVTFGLLAAYGSFAPPQIVRLESESDMKTARLFPGREIYVSLDVAEGETIFIDAALPCVIPAVAQLDKGNEDLREMCFGITSVKVVEIL